MFAELAQSAELAAAATNVFAQSESSGTDFSNFGVIFLASGFVFYGIVYLRYRNVNKRHGHETETEATVHNMRAEDHLVKSLKGLSNSRIAGENGDEVRGARRRFF